MRQWDIHLPIANQRHEGYEMKIMIYAITPVRRGRPPKKKVKYYCLEPYSPRRWYMAGRDDGGRMYELPKNYRVVYSQFGTPTILDAHEWVYSILMPGSDGLPELRGYNRVKLYPAITFIPWTTTTTTTAHTSKLWTIPTYTSTELRVAENTSQTKGNNQ